MGIYRGKKIRTRGASTVEYIVLITAIIGVLIIFLQPQGIFQRTLTSIFDEGADQMLDMSKGGNPAADSGSPASDTGVVLPAVASFPPEFE